MSRIILQALLLLLSMASLAANAQTRTWLDRDRIEFGETVTLNIETDTGASPDYAPLQADFQISGRSSSRQMTLTNGRAVSRTLYAVALKPQREGVLTVPALDIGGQRTDPLSLVVAPASAVSPARAGDDVFLESEPDDTTPYVQQTVGWVVRLYAAVPLVSGQLDQAAPEGATLQQVGDDAQYSRQIDGRRYNVIERRYLLIPERSGSLSVPGASFEGRGAAGFFEDFLGRGGGALHAQARPRVLEVQPIPKAAPQPWLPLHDMKLRYLSTPQQLHAGVAATVTVEAVVDGATTAQVPELQLPPVEGVQVFAEPAQTDERFVDGRPQVTVTRQFSLVPSRAGVVTLPGLPLQWWDVDEGATRTAKLPPLEWTVAPAAGGLPVPPMDASLPSAVSEPAPANVIAGADRGWVLATALFALLWLVTLVWGLHRLPAGTSPSAASTPARTDDSKQDGAKQDGAKSDVAGFKRALASSDFEDIADRLCRLARLPAGSIDEVCVRLDDPAQVDALDAMQRARWGGGDGVVARQMMRAAFARGPRWRPSSPEPVSPLPPLYPKP
ncbi:MULTISPECIES: BatD family protein [unclassified Lysobacter]